MKRYAIFRILQAYIELALLVIVLMSGFGVEALVIVMVISRLSVGALMLGFIFREIGFVKPKFTRIKEFLKFSLPLVPVNTFSWIVSGSDKLLISYYLGTLFVGYFNPGYSMGAMLAMFNTPIMYALPTYIYKFYEEREISWVKSFLRYTLKYYLTLTIPAAVGLSVLAKPLLLIISNRDIANRGYFIVYFVVMAVILNGITALLSLVIEALKKTHVVGISSGVAAAVSLILNIAFFTWLELGILGAAITFLIAATVDFTIRAIIVSRHLVFHIDWISIGRNIAASAIMGLAIWFFNPVGILQVAIAIISGALIYIIVTIVLHGINNNEMKFLAGLIPFKK